MTGSIPAKAWQNCKVNFKMGWQNISTSNDIFAIGGAGIIDIAFHMENLL